MNWRLMIQLTLRVLFGFSVTILCGLITLWLIFTFVDSNPYAGIMPIYLLTIGGATIAIATVGMWAFERISRKLTRMKSPRSAKPPASPETPAVH